MTYSGTRSAGWSGITSWCVHAFRFVFCFGWKTKQCEVYPTIPTSRVNGTTTRFAATHLRPLVWILCQVCSSDTSTGEPIHPILRNHDNHHPAPPPPNLGPVPNIPEVPSIASSSIHSLGMATITNDGELFRHAARARGRVVLITGQVHT